MGSPLKRKDHPSKKTYYLAEKAQRSVTRMAKKKNKDNPNESAVIEEIIFAVEKIGLEHLLRIASEYTALNR